MGARPDSRKDEGKEVMTETEIAMEHDREMEKTYLPNEPIERCIELAAQVLDVDMSSVYIVMFAFVLGGYKALCSSNQIHDNHGHYVEVVYNDKKNEFYAIHYEETDRFVATLHKKTDKETTR